MQPSEPKSRPQAVALTFAERIHRVHEGLVAVALVQDLEQWGDGSVARRLQAVHSDAAAGLHAAAGQRLDEALQRPPVTRIRG